jgi:hypothetical protein
MARRFAADTSVPVERTKAEIEKLVISHGATSFGSSWQDGKAVVAFTMRDRKIKFTLTLPKQGDDEFLYTPSKQWTRSEKDQQKAWEQACRSRWRALCLAIRAKLEAVEVQISEFDSEFMAFIVDPYTGCTLGEQVTPLIAAAYQGNHDRPIGLPAPEEVVSDSSRIEQKEQNSC